MRQGIPPIVITQARYDTLGHSAYFVVTGWDSLGNRFFVRDGGARGREISGALLNSVWEPAGGRALIVTRRRK